MAMAPYPNETPRPGIKPAAAHDLRFVTRYRLTWTDALGSVGRNPLLRGLPFSAGYAADPPAGYSASAGGACLSNPAGQPRRGWPPGGVGPGSLVGDGVGFGGCCLAHIVDPCHARRGALERLVPGPVFGGWMAERSRLLVA